EGKSRADARAALEEVGLTMVEGDPEDVPQEAGTVSSTNPQGGATVEKGSEVVVRFASGNVEMPDVEGIQVDKARQTLESRGFVVNEPSEREDESEDPGTVLSQTPAAGGSVRYGASVDLVVATAPGPVSVPNVAGRQLADAQKVLSDAGFGTEPAEEYSDSVPEGQVIRTDPGANEQVERGSTITVIVSKGPKPAPSPTKTPSESPSEAPRSAG